MNKIFDSFYRIDKKGETSLNVGNLCISKLLKFIGNYDFQNRKKIGLAHASKIQYNSQYNSDKVHNL